MRVLKKATWPQPEKETKVDCITCGSQLEYTSADVKTKCVGGGKFRSFKASYITCPVCEHDMLVWEKAIDGSQAVPARAL